MSVKVEKLEYYVVGTLLDADGKAVNYAVKENKIDIKNFEAQLKGNILDVYIKTKYYYPADEITLLFL